MPAICIIGSGLADTTVPFSIHIHSIANTASDFSVFEIVPANQCAVIELAPIDDFEERIHRHDYEAQWILREAPFDLVPSFPMLKAEARFNRKVLRCNRKGIGLRIKQAT